MEVREIQSIEQVWNTFNTLAEIYEAIEELHYGWCNRENINLEEMIPGLECLRQPNIFQLKTNSLCYPS
jgi:hypothetical protein